MNKQEIIEKLESIIKECKEQASIFEQSEMETSKHCSLAMAIAYNKSLELIQSLTTEPQVGRVTAKEYLQNKYPEMRGDKWNSHDVIDDEWVARMMEEYATQSSAEAKEKDFKAKARDSANSLRELLQYSPPLIEDNMYKSMVEMMDLVLVLTNDIEYSDIVKVRASNAEAMREHAIGFMKWHRKINDFYEYKEITYKNLYSDYLTTLTK